MHKQEEKYDAEIPSTRCKRKNEYIKRETIMQDKNQNKTLYNNKEEDEKKTTSHV